MSEFSTTQPQYYLSKADHALAHERINPAERLDKVRAYANAQGSNAAYVRNLSDVKWLAAFDHVFDTEQAHAFAITQDKAVLHTDSRYAEACKREAACVPVEISDEVCSHPAFLTGVLQSQAENEPVSVLGQKCLSVTEYEALDAEIAKHDNLSLNMTAPYIINLRAVKDTFEIARMKAAQAITDAAFAHMCEWMRVGMTEREIQIELEYYMTRMGAEGLAFSSIVASGPNGADPHAIPGERRIQEGETLVMDFGARACGYCSDMTRTVVFGHAPDVIQRAYHAMRRANEECEAMIKPGLTGREIHEHALAVIAEEGFGGRMAHGLGHGVGIDIHEEPVLAPRNTTPLEVGNVVTVEPGIYVPGEFGMRLEDYGVVTEDGYEVFTKSPHELIIL